MPPEGQLKKSWSTVSNAFVKAILIMSAGILRLQRMKISSSDVATLS